MDLIILIFNVIITGYITFCVLFTTFFIVRFISNYRKEVAKLTPSDQADLSTVKLVSVEVVADRVMMYDAVTNAFICQADTEEALWTTAEAMFPGKSLLRYINT
jgi:hypothetical protein